MVNKDIVIIGYSGHSYVVIDALHSMSRVVTAYCDQKEKENNPFNLGFCRDEQSVEGLKALGENDYFISIGDNSIRHSIYRKLKGLGLQEPINAIHQKSIIGSSVALGKGIYIGPNAIINALSRIGNGVIINTAAIIEHECAIGDFCHIGPSATLAGNVKVGHGTFIGANAVIKQNINIGDHVVIGAGAVIIKDIPDNSVVVGNPQRFINE